MHVFLRKKIKEKHVELFTFIISLQLLDNLLMKRIIQFFLFFILVMISIFFYNTYFIKDKKIKEIITENENKESSEIEKNLIKNLKYDVILENDNRYTINADRSKIIYIDNIELVSMEIVVAKFFSNDGSILIITSDKAIFNNSSYNTKFEDNVVIKYAEHTITSDKLDLNFNENIVTIYENVIYQGYQGKIETDNAIINLITKNVELFMNSPEEKMMINLN